MNILQNKINLFSRIGFKVNEKNLLKFRKVFLTMSILFLVATCIDVYVSKFSIQVMWDLVLSIVMFIFANKCEVLLLKLKIENYVDNQLEIKEE